jgi:hypothetical protein
MKNRIYTDAMLVCLAVPFTVQAQDPGLLTPRPIGREVPADIDQDTKLLPRDPSDAYVSSLVRRVFEPKTLNHKDLEAMSFDELLPQGCDTVAYARDLHYYSYLLKHGERKNPKLSWLLGWAAGIHYDDALDIFSTIEKRSGTMVTLENGHATWRAHSKANYELLSGLHFLRHSLFKSMLPGAGMQAGDARGKAAYLARQARWSASWTEVYAESENALDRSNSNQEVDDFIRRKILPKITFLYQKGIMGSAPAQDGRREIIPAIDYQDQVRDRGRGAAERLRSNRYWECTKIELVKGPRVLHREAFIRKLRRVMQTYGHKTKNKYRGSAAPLERQSDKVHRVLRNYQRRR